MFALLQGLGWEVEPGDVAKVCYRLDESRKLIRHIGC